MMNESIGVSIAIKLNSLHIRWSVVAKASFNKARI